MAHRKYYKKDELPEYLLNSIVRTAYNDAGFFEKIRVERLAAKDPLIGNILKDYKETARSVHSIKIEECPQELLEIIPERRLNSRIGKPSFTVDLYTTLLSKPVSTIAVTVLLTITVLSVVLLNRYEQFNNYDKAEVELASRQTKYALAIIGKVFNTTTKSLTDEILNEKVSKPINEGIKTVNKIFIDEGDKK
ncbi:MAG: hypothetical protein JW995_11940 [Melioribacteraceae bacterium]|nr:hypothetical protein [Melioribacteraceae bacterium]